MTKAGHNHTRRALVEGAWAYRFPPRSADISSCDSKHNQTSSRTSVGRPTSGWVNAPDDSSHEANMPPWSRWPGPCAGETHVGHGQGDSWTTVSPQERAPLHPQRSRFPACLGRDAAPVWCHPRRR
jgi:hypothetical protein